MLRQHSARDREMFPLSDISVWRRDWLEKVLGHFFFSPFNSINDNYLINEDSFQKFK